MTRRQVRALLVLGLLLLMVNLPMALSWTTERRITTQGVDVIARLVSADAGGTADDPRYVVSFQLPERLDPSQAVLGAAVSAEVFTAAERSGTVPVRVLESRPTTAYRVAGQVTTRAGTWITLAVDLLLAGLVVLLWRSGRYRRRDPVVLVATADLEPDPTGRPEMFDVGGGEFVVRGWVGESSPDEVVLEVSRRQVRLLLAGFANPVAAGELALARGRPVEE